MLKDTARQMQTALLLLSVLTVLTGLVYPFVITVVAQTFFPWQANGSMIEHRGKLAGSLLIGQSFSSPDYFWGRPSATTPFPYNGALSSGSNRGPSDLDFMIAVKERVVQLKQLSHAKEKLVPVDLVTASGSGLDPEISPLAAFYQVSRIAKHRHLSEEKIRKLITSQIKKRSFGVLGEPRINVLMLNLALDNLRMPHGQSTPNA